MKFDPKLPSFIIALNQLTREEDLALIADFYTGTPTELMGYWKGKQERSYQISCKHGIDFANMVNILKFVGQEAYISINFNQRKEAWLTQLNISPRDGYPIITKLGTLTEVDGETGDCTHCLATNTFWKAL